MTNHFSKFLICLFMLVSSITFSQDQSNGNSKGINKKRLKTITIGGGAAYTATMVGLNYLWYADFERESFHFFNDNSEWKQIDKVGHFFSAYQLNKLGTRGFQWTGMSDNKANLWGSITGVLVLTPIEILDGFSSAYGASWGDMIANTSGALFHYGQYQLWKEQKIYPKFSFRRSGLAGQRPLVLGSAFHEELLKDYNAQTYWLSFDIYKFHKNENNDFPKWLNLAVGYGADNLVFANDLQNIANGYNPTRQFYVGIDFDFSHIESKSKFINTMLYVLEMIHLPAPAMEIGSDRKVKFRPLAF